jgi:hypothetical protein
MFLSTFLLCLALLLQHVSSQSMEDVRNLHVLDEVAPGLPRGSALSQDAPPKVLLLAIGRESEDPTVLVLCEIRIGMLQEAGVRDARLELSSVDLVVIQPRTSLQHRLLALSRPSLEHCRFFFWASFQPHVSCQVGLAELRS